jgi:polyisoprenoid-binding protein YceI
VSRWRVVPEKSRLWAEARSSLHPVRVETSGLTGDIEAEVGADGRVRLGAPFRVEIDAELLRSSNGLIDIELQRRLETRKFPRVVGAVAEALEAGATWRLRGELTLHGVPRAEEATVTARLLAADTIEIEGEKVIDMRDYGLNPPRFLMLRVHPDVKVRAKLVAVRA